MAQTQVRGSQILNNTVQRQDLDTSTVGQAVITKVIQGSGITLSSTGSDSGTGDVTVAVSPAVPAASSTTPLMDGTAAVGTGTTFARADHIHPSDTSRLPATAISADAGNIATLGSDNLILVPQSQIWSVRLRSFNAIGNSNFECDQAVAGTVTVGTSAIRICDRWFNGKAGIATGVCTAQRVTSGSAANQILIPGTNFGITNSYIRYTVTTQQASLVAADALYHWTTIEGPVFRELQSDVHSLQVLLRSSVAGLSVGLSLRDAGTTTRSLTKLATIPSANTWTLLSFANLPLWPSAGNFTSASGAASYIFTITLASGSTSMSPANDTWQTGNFLGAVGQSNFLAQAINSTLDIAFVQHEPGSVCTQLMDLDLVTNLDRCMRYYQKSFNYADKPGTATAAGAPNVYVAAGLYPLIFIPFTKKMAKVPTITGYAVTTGAINNVKDWTANIDRAISGSQTPGEGGFGGFTLSTSNAALAQYQFQFTADTGW